MTEIEALLNDIEKLRKNLHSIVNDKNHNLMDPEIIAASKMLNTAITKYTEIMNKIVNK